MATVSLFIKSLEYKRSENPVDKLLSLYKKKNLRIAFYIADCYTGIELSVILAKTKTS